MHREGKTYDIPISTTRITIRKMKRGGGEIECNYPILRFTDWMESLLGKHGSEFLLGGYRIEDEAQYQDMFSRFWDGFCLADPLHPIHGRSPEEKSRTIPVAIHGDEGRGLAKVPVMIESVQPIVSWMGEDVVNSLGSLGLM